MSGIRPGRFGLAGLRQAAREPGTTLDSRGEFRSHEFQAVERPFGAVRLIGIRWQGQTPKQLEHDGQGHGYVLPAGDGSYIATNPDAHAAYASGRDAALGGHFKSFVQMLKAWNRAHSAHLKSFRLEVMVGSMFTSMDADSREKSEIFFRNAA